jgi:hypothetical protein
MPFRTATEAEARSAGLTPEETARALTLAGELYREAHERESAIKAAEEVGVAPEYLVRAISQIVADRERRAAAAEGIAGSVRRVAFALIAACIAGAILWPVALWWTPSRFAAQSVPVAPPPPPLYAAPPPRPAAVLQPLPVPPLSTLRFRTMLNLEKGDVTFQNKTGEPVRIEWIDGVGDIEEDATLSAGENRTENVYVTIPWIATDLSNRPLAVYFPTAYNSTLPIARASAVHGAAAAGYLAPASVGPLVPPVPAPDMGAAGMDFVNFTAKPVEIYADGQDSRPIWVTHLAAYDEYFNHSGSSSMRWIIADETGDVLETFVAPANADYATALILPDIVR